MRSIGAFVALVGVVLTLGACGQSPTAPTITSGVGAASVVSATASSAVPSGSAGRAEGVERGDFGGRFDDSIVWGNFTDSIVWGNLTDSMSSPR